jgi:hypothetical protein
MPKKPTDKVLSVDGVWNGPITGMYGGSILSHRFANNPQYSLMIEEPTQV